MKRQNISSHKPFEEEYGYSRAVRMGDHIHVAGTCAQAPHDTGNAYEQATAALDIIGTALTEAGAGFGDVVRTVVYVTDMGDMHEVARAHRERFAGIMPASTIVQVAALGGPGLCIEIEAYAIVAESCGAGQ